MFNKNNQTYLAGVLYDKLFLERNLPNFAKSFFREAIIRLHPESIYQQLFSWTRGSNLVNLTDTSSSSKLAESLKDSPFLRVKYF